MTSKNCLIALNRTIVQCKRCPRLREYCAHVAQTRRAAFRNETYHGRPVPNFGDPNARVLILGLAPAAHGANRTGRMFTGDRSGDFLYEAMYRTGFANQPTAVHANDGLTLHDALITAACHCAPPDNKPTPQELANCATWLEQTIALLENLRVVICLGKIALDALLRYARKQGWIETMAPYKFAHGAEYDLGPGRPVILCSYHPSQQNTFTGRLTMPMLEAIFKRAATLAKEASTAKRQGARQTPGTPRNKKGA